MEKNKTPLKQLLDLCQEGADYRRNDEYCQDITKALDIVIQKIKELLTEERKMVEGAFDKSRERINHPDWDYIYDDFKDFFDQTYEQ